MKNLHRELLSQNNSIVQINYTDGNVSSRRHSIDSRMAQSIQRKHLPLSRSRHFYDGAETAFQPGNPVPRGDVHHGPDFFRLGLRIDFGISGPKFAKLATIELFLAGQCLNGLTSPIQKVEALVVPDIVDPAEFLNLTKFDPVDRLDLAALTPGPARLSKKTCTRMNV